MLVTTILESLPGVKVKDGMVARENAIPPKPLGETKRCETNSKTRGPTADDSDSIATREPPPDIHAFRKVPETGVIYVTNRATEMGFTSGHPEWANLGQGSPETSSMDSWPKSVRKSIAALESKGLVHTNVLTLDSIPVSENNSHYGPVNGDWEMRCAVAKYYNEMFRKGTASQYTADNVAIVGGGRLALTRICSAVGQINLGHFLPDYTAYEELLGVFRNISSIPITLDAENNFKCTLKDLKKEIVGRGLSALLFSNPCNPTGQVIEGEELKQWVKIARDTQCSFIIDEIYSRYIYSQKMAPGDAHWRIVSAAQFIKDVDRDPVILLDGFTKSFRLPGVRCCWIVAPRSVIEAVGAAGSFLDGGAALPTQKSLVPFLDVPNVINDTILLQNLFAHKRAYVLNRLQEMGLEVEHAPVSTFYIWCSVAALPPPINNGTVFFQEGLKQKVMVVPGKFFDVNPGSRRVACRYESYIRISYGPSFEVLVKGMDAIERIIQAHL